jgi:hypothetical protein
MGHEKRLGPLVTIRASCFGCSFYIGDTTWDTPSWCPVLESACVRQVGAKT